jgi:hypothetical protein
MLLGRQTHFSKAEAYFLQWRNTMAIRRSKKLKRRKRDRTGRRAEWAALTKRPEFFLCGLCVFAPWREMGFLIQAAVLATAQRRKGRKGKT